MHKFRLITASVILFLVMFVLSANIHAQDARSMTIIPPKFELFANPGDQISETIRVRNDSTSPSAYTVLVEDFTSTGEEGAVVLEEGETDQLFSLASWIQPEATDLILQPGEEKAFGILITVPKNAEPGGHYASVLFQAASGEVQGGAGVTQRVGALVLLRVSGNVTENAQIETFAAPTYSPTTPLNITLRLKNNGNTHVRPKGTIIITDIFGKKIDELPLNGQNVIPGATRKMDTEWNRPNTLGYYTATLVSTYGEQSLPLTSATKFLVVNTTSAILIGIGVISGLLFIISIISGKSRLLRALQVIISGK